MIEGLPRADRQSGRAALEAVANPSRTKDLYFVADGTGGHAFADSLEAHQRNVARWRAVEKSRQAPPDAVDKVEPGPDPATPGRASAYARAAPRGQRDQHQRGLRPGYRHAGHARLRRLRGHPPRSLKNRSYDLGSPRRSRP